MQNTTSGSSDRGVHMKVIKTDAEYQSALEEVEKLISLDPVPGTTEADTAELLTTLVQAYEVKHFPIGIPDALTAIRFRMEQQNLSQNDLVPYLGSRSRASEILAGKRPLSLSMIRALHYGLGIPASVLLQKPSASQKEEDIDWRKFPIKEMVKRGWIQATSISQDNILEVLRDFFGQIMPSPAMANVYLKKDHVRSHQPVDYYALAAWSTRILIRANALQCPARYQPGVINQDFLRKVAKLSRTEDGPSRALDFLLEHGIAVVIEEHLPKTYIDGAAMMAPSGQPVIGLTLRRDRIDNFWFVLMHELVHIWRHVHSPICLFFDDLDEEANTDRQEKDADELAREALIPRRVWDRSHAKVLRSPDAAKLLADELAIHPAIVAGRMRWEAKNYKILNQMIGRGQVKRLFPEKSII